MSLAESVTYNRMTTTRRQQRMPFESLSYKRIPQSISPLISAGASFTRFEERR